MRSFEPVTDSYSSFERRWLAPWRRAVASVFALPVRLLAALRVSPNAVSFLQIPLALLLFPLMPYYPRIAFLLFVATLLVDALDGALARARNVSSVFGAFFDQVCDHARETLVIAALVWHGALMPVLGVVYPLVYCLFNFLLYLCNGSKVSLPVAAKSYLFVYPALFLYLWFGVNFMDIGVAVSLCAMMVVIVVGLMRLSKVWEKKETAHA